MESWHSYPKIYNLGHAALDTLLSGPVYLEEKVDGSQFSFGVDSSGKLLLRSKGREFVAGTEDDLFRPAVATAVDLVERGMLKPGYTYRGEAFKAPRHNHLTYSRVPRGNVILFDICTGQESYFDPQDKADEAERIGLEVVPLLGCTMQRSGDVLFDEISERMKLDSVLGGCKIEGVVVKPWPADRFGKDGKLLMGKFVSPTFKEEQGKAWKTEHIGPSDFREAVAQRYRTDARWRKAVQHLREDGELTGEMADLAKIMPAVAVDVLEECRAAIEAEAFAWTWKYVKRRLTAGLPEWYREQLAQGTEADTEWAVPQEREAA